MWRPGCGCGNIPAYTGKTHAQRAADPQAAEHPRLHGENPRCAPPRAASYGTSPPTRGKRSGHSRCAGCCRNIPAYTGKTVVVRVSSISGSEHPRLHGENVLVPVLIPVRLGTSPPTRGKRTWCCSCRPGHRNIPAYTGKTTTATAPRAASAEHPRLHGENTISAPPSQPRFGTSPPTRGKRSVWGAFAFMPRNIPAYTGKTRCRPVPGVHGPEHPRLHGEN